MTRFIPSRRQKGQQPARHKAYLRPSARISLGLTYLALSVFVVLAVSPFAISILSAFKSDTEIILGAFTLPEVWRWGNFAQAWEQGRFSRYFLNSTIVVIPVVVISSVLSLMSGYAFGRMSFGFSRVLFMLFLVGVMMPLEAFILPLYYLMERINLLDSYWALILPQIGLSVSFGTFWMRGFFSSVPRELTDAAKLDGCTTWGALWHVLFPVVRPALFTLAVLFFIWTWNDFLLALVMISSEEFRTLPQGLAFFSGRYTSNIPLTAAGVSIVALPTILIYVVFQRQFVRGLTGGAVNG